MPQVKIQNKKTGEEYEINSADFRRGKHHRNAKTGEMETYEDAGFQIVSLADGGQYTPPTPPAERSSS